MQANPIAYSEILAFCQLSGAEINSTELDLLRELDDYVLSIVNNGGKIPIGDKPPATKTDVSRMKNAIRGAARPRNDEGNGDG